MLSPSHYDPKKHDRRTIRLPGYDYRSPGLYYITQCIHENRSLLGVIKDGQFYPNDAGMMVQQRIQEIEIRFPASKCHAHVVMPNHIHFVIEIVSETNTSLGNMMQWFKSITTADYIRGIKGQGWPRFDDKLWKRNYYEHIIRNAKSYEEILKYIINNPANWPYDQFNDAPKEDRSY